MTTYTATYSPDDNKLRLYASARLDADTFARIKAAGFRWAPKQDLFFAPMWTPDRADILIELAGEIGDEDTTLVDRAEVRADRFEDYSEKRAQDSERAYATVAKIADGIPLGQPILIGHHSERNARRDQKRIENGMRKAVDMWKTAEYWEQRAAGCLQHAKYKELPSVRARRIKGIEADLRKIERTLKGVQVKRALWETCDSEDMARRIAATGHYPVKRSDTGNWTAYDVLQPEESRYKACPSMTWEEVREILRVGSPDSIPRCERWIEHYNNRLTYEKAMLAEQGASDLIAPKPRRVGKSALPMLNYRAEGGTITTTNMYHRGQMITYPQVDMTKAEYARINKDYKGSRISADGSHRFRTAMQRSALVCVFLTDSKAHALPPALVKEAAE